MYLYFEWDFRYVSLHNCKNVIFSNVIICLSLQLMEDQNNKHDKPFQLTINYKGSHIHSPGSRGWEKQLSARGRQTQSGPAWEQKNSVWSEALARGGKQWNSHALQDPEEEKNISV